MTKAPLLTEQSQTENNTVAKQADSPTLIVVPFKSVGVPATIPLSGHDETSFDNWYNDAIANCDALMEVKLVIGGKERAAAFFDNRASQCSTLSPRNVKQALALHKYLTAGK